MTFEEFMAARSHALLRYAVMLTGDRELALDITQEAMARAALRWRRISEADRPELYVKRMLTNEYLTWRRGSWFRRVVLRDEPAADWRDGSTVVPDHAEHAVRRDEVWELLARKRAGVALGEAALFNGIRSRELDYIYRDEIEHFAAEGVIDHVHVVASRENPALREYVQDRLRAEGALLWRLLDAGGYVYVCGSQAMREGVRAAFVDVAVEHGSMPSEHADAYLDRLETIEQRYRPDLWG